MTENFTPSPRRGHRRHHRPRGRPSPRRRDRAGGRTLTPFHTAPWVDDPAVHDDPDVPPTCRFLSGDFFCAPFATATSRTRRRMAGRPTPHGRCSATRRVGTASTARFGLAKPVMGARVIKEITLRDGHPFVYQRHIFEGGNGAVSVASHAMTRFAGEGRLSFSPKAYAETPDRSPQEPDPAARPLAARLSGALHRSRARCPSKDGGTAISAPIRSPTATRTSSCWSKQTGARLGWAAAVRPDARRHRAEPQEPGGVSGDDAVVLERRARLRAVERPPHRRARHRGGPRLVGLWPCRLDCAESAVDLGRADMVDLGGSVSLSHVVGGIARPEGWSEVATVESATGAR